LTSWISKTVIVTPGPVAPKNSGVSMLVTGLPLSVPLMSAGNICRLDGTLLSLRVKLYVTLLPTDPALSVAKISIVFIPLVI